MTAAVTSIASLYHKGIHSFSQLCKLLQAPECEFSYQVSLPGLENELGRFRVWAGNVGAHRKGRVSLDHKLRCASEVHNEVSELLNELGDALQEAIAIVSHERQPFDQLSWSPKSSTYSPEEYLPTAGSDKMNLTTELQEHLLEVAHIITCLYRFSIAIRNPVSRDRLQKCASINVSHYEPFDIQHATHKFPNAENYLIDRLAKANSRRRQLLKYYEKHHGKLAYNIDPLQPEVSDGDQGLGGGTIAGTVNTQTTVSTYIQGSSETIEVCSNSGQSQTSYATSTSGSTELRVPPPPEPHNAFDGDPFECPYCFSMITVNDQMSWMKHVFRDLRPYVCTFKDCLKPDVLFDSRHDWYDHELDAHRREWLCNACHQPFLSKKLFESHLRQSHLGLFTETKLPTIIDMCERAIEGTEQMCPLCGDRYSPRRLQSHLARHMQQLALFILPSTSDETNDGGSVGVQASETDEDKTEESSLGSVDLDLSSAGPYQRIMEISSTPINTKHGHMEESEALEDVGARSGGVQIPFYQSRRNSQGQRISSRYLTPNQLSGLLVRTFGAGNFSAQLRDGEWEITAPRRVTQEEIYNAQEL